MEQRYPNLLKPYQIRNFTFKNRMLCGPLGYNESNPAGSMIAHNVDYYGALARGGTARVTTGDMPVNGTNAGYFGGEDRVHLFEDPLPMEISNSIKSYANAIHPHDCLAFVQFEHEGCSALLHGSAPLARSMEQQDGNSALLSGNQEHEDSPCTASGQITAVGPVSFVRDDGIQVMGMDEAMMEEVCRQFAACARNAKMLGVDGCIIHGGHGKLIDQFRSAYFNTRTDEYGGSVANRCRFPIRLLRTVREAVGPDFLIELRVSVHEFFEGGITIDETIEFFRLLDDLGIVDLFHLTAGIHFDAKLNMRSISPAFFEPACNVKFAEKIKAAGIKTPLVLINSLSDPDISEEILASGKADFICMSRQINLADPYYPRKIMENRPEYIDNCLRCYGCYDMTGPCSVNPLASAKISTVPYEMPKAVTPRKVVVVGGGIAGMKAAFTAAERGHSVILYEKEDALGGVLRFADTDAYKVDIKRYKNNMIKRINASEQIEVRLNVTATPELVAEDKPYAVIACVGGRPRMPDIPRDPSGPNVLTPMDVYLHPDLVAQEVVMLGSGLIGCEVGMHLAKIGKHVTVIGRPDVLAAHEVFMPPVFNPVPSMMEEFEAHGVQVITGCSVTAITADGVVGRRKDGSEVTCRAGTVVLAAGTDANRDAAQAFAGLSPYFRIAGDCREPKKIRQAVSAGYYAAMDI